jgi:serine/threonine-protein kinase RsbW
LSPSNPLKKSTHFLLSLPPPLADEIPEPLDVSRKTLSFTERPRTQRYSGPAPSGDFNGLDGDIHSSGMKMNTLEVPTNLKSLPTLEAFVSEVARQHDCSLEQIQDMRLVLEEIFTNLVFYAYPQWEGSVRVTCFHERETRFCIEFRDEGIPFNPLEYHVSDLNRDFSEREIGGLGIHLVRELVSEIHYSREDQSNVVTVCFEI